jgi:hypothetical protein
MTMTMTKDVTSCKGNIYDLPIVEVLQHSMTPKELSPHGQNIFEEYLNLLLSSLVKKITYIVYGFGWRLSKSNKFSS